MTKEARRFFSALDRGDSVVKVGGMTFYSEDEMVDVELNNADGDEKPEETPERLEELIENKDDFPMPDMVKIGYIKKLAEKDKKKAQRFVPDLQKMLTSGRQNLISAAQSTLALLAD